MKTTDPATLTLLASGKDLQKAECYTFGLTDGTVIRTSGLEVPVVINGTYFPATGIRVDGLRMKQSAEIKGDDEQTVTITAAPTDLVSGVPFLQALRLRRFDQATILRQRAIFDPDLQPNPIPVTGKVAGGVVPMFYGQVGEISDLGRTSAKVKVKSILNILNIQMPRNLFSLGCVNVYGDAQCGVNPATFQETGYVEAGSTGTSLIWAGADLATGYYGQGKVTFLSGTNIGLSRTVRTSSWSGGTSTASVNYRFDSPPAIGDMFVIQRGCPRTLAACNIRGGTFRGFPFQPPVSVAQ